jgi:hypothetical protein
VLFIWCVCGSIILLLPWLLKLFHGKWQIRFVDMSDNEKLVGEGTTPRGADWEVVTLTASAYEAAPGSIGTEVKPATSCHLYRALFFLGLFMAVELLVLLTITPRKRNWYVWSHLTEEKYRLFNLVVKEMCYLWFVIYSLVTLCSLHLVPRLKSAWLGHRCLDMIYTPNACILIILSCAKLCVIQVCDESLWLLIATYLKLGREYSASAWK